MSQTNLEALTAALLAAGVPRGDVRLALDLGKHGALKAQESIATVADTAPLHLQLAIRLVALLAIEQANEKMVTSEWVMAGVAAAARRA